MKYVLIMLLFCLSSVSAEDYKKGQYTKPHKTKNTPEGYTNRIPYHKPKKVPKYYKPRTTPWAFRRFKRSTSGSVSSTYAVRGYTKKNGTYVRAHRRRYSR